MLTFMHLMYVCVQPQYWLLNLHNSLLSTLKHKDTHLVHEGYAGGCRVSMHACRYVCKHIGQGSRMVGHNVHTYTQDGMIVK